MNISFGLILLTVATFLVAAKRDCYKCRNSDCYNKREIRKTRCNDDSDQVCFSAYTNDDRDRTAAKGCAHKHTAKDICDRFVHKLNGVCYFCTEDLCNEYRNNNEWQQ